MEVLDKAREAFKRRQRDRYVNAASSVSGAAACTSPRKTGRWTCAVFCFATAPIPTRKTRATATPRYTTPRGTAMSRR